MVRLRRHVLTRKLRKCQAVKGQITPVGTNLINKYFVPNDVFDAKFKAKTVKPLRNYILDF